jgi:hypothetical protein
MKTIALIACLAASGAMAQTVIVANTHSAPRARNLLLINPGDLFSGIVSMEYERALTSFFGLTGGFSVTAFNGPFNMGRESYTLLGPEIGARFHFIQDAPGGLWLGPYVNAGYLINNPVTRAFAWGLGAAIGYNFIIGRHFTFQLGAGGGFNDYGGRSLVWAPRLKLGLGGVF